VEKDITSFIKDQGTGQEIPDPPKFINFCRGDAETSSQTSDDDNYSVAQFARTMNPAYRASSPQPSMFESHHDPNNPLARELLGRDTRPIPQDEINVVPRQQAQPPQLVQPVEYVQPAQPIQREQPIQPVQREQPSQPVQREQPIQPAQREQPIQPVQREQPIQPVQREQPIQPVQREQPIQPVQRIQPMQPVQREQPVQPVQPVQYVQPPQPARSIQPDPRLVQAQQQAHQQYQQNKVPHNDYPADGMTQFCRIGPPSERSNIPSPVRPSSRDSQSDFSSPTSFSSIEPPSGSASPGKPMAMSPQPQAPEEMSVQKKKGFFQNSPFSRRKSRHEEKPPVLKPPTSRNTWGPTTNSSSNENASPTRQFGRGGRGIVLKDPQSASPEPVDPRANFQLNIGNNVFDVASPDAKKEKVQESTLEDLDPIAQALAELKGVTKQSSVRVSADRYHGLATPMPGTPSVGAEPPGNAPPPLTNVNVNAAKRGTPPPSYEQPPMSRLGAPQPAHTARQMQKTTQMYVDQKVSMFNTGSTTRAQSRPPPTRSATSQEPPRAVSPAPTRATSPRPGMYTSQQQQQPPRATSPRPSTYSSQQQQQPPTRATSPRPSKYTPQQQPKPQSQSPAAYRSVSPNPYAASNAGGRPRAQTASQKQNSYAAPTARGSYSSSRGGSPNIQRAVSPQPTYANTRPSSRAAPTSRAVSPQPQFRQTYDRPSSSRGSDMALQLAPGPGSERGDGSVYGGSVRGRSGGGQQQRPQSSYYSGSGSDLGYNAGGGSQLSDRVRSKSVAEPRQYTRDGRMILHYCEYLPLTLLQQSLISRQHARCTFTTHKSPKNLPLRRAISSPFFACKTTGGGRLKWWVRRGGGVLCRPTICRTVKPVINRSTHHHYCECVFDGSCHYSFSA
jgi:hypothetical protein